ncbi:cytochrome c1-2, heme protein, mitochondrial-like [Ceratina calcarata]|uniref:Cytochrome c1-2, heme protein, mitochondrial-like n=1 Tax=Ceratina calcarata TaxID=156304 RepID=A0AAJ7WAJ4_9HYME|nr:cytochrome c1-2, heme protein, mitochondrial-like [Ceratina calcarata]
MRRESGRFLALRLCDCTLATSQENAPAGGRYFKERTSAIRENRKEPANTIRTGAKRTRNELFIDRRLVSNEKMMAMIGKVNRLLSRKRFDDKTGSWVKWKQLRKRPWLGIVAGLFGSCGTIVYFLNDSSVKASEGLEPILPSYPWAFKGPFTAFDHAALRRGWIVYRNVCSTCHSLQYVRFLDLVNVTHTLDEVKDIASEYEVEDGPDDQGEYYMRPAKLTDPIPPPYPNEQAARAANFGSYPADLSYIIYTRHNGFNFMFSLLTGWMDPPAGVEVGEAQYFNIYFPGGLTGMAQMLFDGMVEYDDGTVASQSQMAKDVVEFLSWTAAPEHDTRKIMTVKGVGICLIMTVALAFMYRRYWSHVRSRRLAFVPNCITREPRLPAPVLGSRSGKRS